MKQSFTIFILLFWCTNLFGQVTSPSESEMIKTVKEEFTDFKVITSEHYIIAYQTSDAYADWYRQMVENMHRSFTDFWKKREASLIPLEEPLVVVLYTSRPAFLKYAVDYFSGDQELKNFAGFYHVRKNYIFLYDSSQIYVPYIGTGSGKVIGAATGQTATTEQIAEFRKRPGIENSIELLIHEGAHQLSFNTGLLSRRADCPVWLTEGVAMIRGASKRKAKNGWEINLKIDDRWYPELRKYLRTNPQDPILSTVKNDALFGDNKTQIHGYAMAWGLTFYLMTKYPKEYIEYMNTVNQPTLSRRTKEARQQNFEQHFGKDWKKLEDDFAKEMMRLW